MTTHSPTEEIPIFLMLKTPKIVEHFNSLLRKMMWKVNVCVHTSELFDKISSVSKAIVFLEDAVSQEEGTNIYGEILHRCRNAKIVLVCKRNRRNLVKDMIEKGGYGSIIEPYDPWEVTTMVKHLITDLTEEQQPPDGRGN